MLGHSSLTIYDMSLLLETVAFPLHFGVCCKNSSLCYLTESLKASMQKKMMMMKIQDDLKINRKQCPVLSMMIDTTAPLFLRLTRFS